MKRYPLDPLVPLIERDWTPGPHTGHIAIRGKAATVLGVSVGVVDRWRKTGLAEAEADRAAILLGAHPAEVWHDWDAHVEYAPLCDKPGHASIHRHHRAGEPLCLDCMEFKAAFQRSLYRRDPQRKLAYQKAWRAANPELERARRARNNAQRRRSA